MPRKRLRVKTLSLMCRKTCEQGESVSLEPESPVVQPKASRRASEAAPTLTRFERMEMRTLRCDQTSSNELDEGDGWAPTLGFPSCAYGTWDSLREETPNGNGAIVVVGDEESSSRGEGWQDCKHLKGIRCVMQ